MQDEAGTADSSQYNYQIGFKMWQKLHNCKENEENIGVSQCINLINGHATIKENSKHLDWNVILNQHTFEDNPKSDNDDENNNINNELYLLQYAILKQCELIG